MKAITIAGNIGKDAVVRTTGQGKKVAGWSVAVDDGFGDSKRTLWFDCALWGERGEKLAPHLTKGSKVTVSGDLSTREHEGRTHLTVRVNELTLQGGGQQRQSGGYEDPQAPLGGQGGGYGGGRGDLDDPDSIPF
jgi:single-strand DNA-binding protein